MSSAGVRGRGTAAAAASGVTSISLSADGRPRDFPSISASSAASSPGRPG
jgi:hypothetical protein